ncbi:hypothetical protein ERJ75_000152500 [Trypanosoma vivax]|nr:hypothetical protein ERJ75_000152500 [Trypanosoma vivax]
MPPHRKSGGLNAVVTGHLPSFQDEKFIEQILHLATENDEDSLIALTAHAMGAECYQVDLGQQILVDNRVDFVMFCASQGYGPGKVAHLIKWLTQFQRTVERGCSVEEMQKEMLSFVASEIEEEWKWKRAAVAEEAQGDVQTVAKTSGRRGMRVVEKLVEEAEAAAMVPKENVYLSKENVGPFCTWLLQGMIRHAPLFFYVANNPRVVGKPEEFQYFIEVPMAAPPLRSALPPEKVAVERPQEAAERNVRELREAELADYVTQYRDSVAREEKRLKTIQNEKEMQLLIENEGTKAAVETAYESLEMHLTKRQVNILQRITALEKALGVGYFAQNM